MSSKPDIRLVIFAGTNMVAGVRDLIAKGIPADTGSLLPELGLLDKAIAALKVARDTVLRHEHDVVGTGFEDIGAATGLHSSTWRYRYDPSIKAVKR